VAPYRFSRRPGVPFGNEAVLPPVVRVKSWPSASECELPQRRGAKRRASGSLPCSGRRGDCSGRGPDAADPNLWPCARFSGYTFHYRQGEPTRKAAGCTNPQGGDPPAPAGLLFSGLANPARSTLPTVRARWCCSKVRARIPPAPVSARAQAPAGAETGRLLACRGQIAVPFAEPPASRLAGGGHCHVVISTPRCGNSARLPAWESAVGRPMRPTAVTVPHA